MTVRPTPILAVAHWRRELARSLSSFRHQIPAAVFEELCQEALLRLVQQPDVQRPAAFLCRVSRRLAIDWLRRRRVRAERQLVLERDEDWGPTWHSDEGSAVGGLDARQDLPRIGRLLQTAPRGYRALLLDVHVGGLSFEELIAQEVTLGADRARARAALYKRRERAERWLARRTEGRP